MSKLKAIVTVGISASGKTTFAKSLSNDWVNVNRDDLRFTITGASGWVDYKFTKATENLVTKMQEELVTQSRSLGKNVVISDTNINPKTRTKWSEMLTELGYEVEFKHFPVKLEEAWKRDNARSNGVGQEVIYNQWLTYHKQFSYQYKPDESLPLAAIFDIDGTIAKMEDRSPFAWDRVGEDSVREEIVAYLNALKNDGYNIILLSGRDSCCRLKTEQWLGANNIFYQELYMRCEGDNRPDTEIKEELFIKYVAENYNVQVVVDDRPCMVRTWYKIGIPNVISVADPYLNF